MILLSVFIYLLIYLFILKLGNFNLDPEIATHVLDFMLMIYNFRLKGKGYKNSDLS